MIQIHSNHATVGEIYSVSLILTQAQIGEVLGPCVYVLYKGPEYLYIGATMRGFCRVFDPGHKMSKVLRTECDMLRIHRCKDAVEARALEKSMIRQFNPRYNYNS